jgi:hypothetical protein
MARTIRFDRPRHEVCFSITTRDRVDVTLQSIASIAFDDGFDLLWFDGSTDDSGRRLPHELAPNMPGLREIHDGIAGGPDVAIVTALARMIALGYAYCGLIESDVRLAPGWFQALMALFGAGAADGLEVGAATARAFEHRILIKRPGYAVTMNPGAGMVLFRRAAAQLVLDHYRTPSTLELRHWYLFACGRDCADFSEPAFRQGPDADVALASDYQYDMVLQRHGLCTLATSPVLATDLEPAVAPGLGGYATPAPAAPDPDAERAVAALRARLAAQRRAPSSLGCYLNVPSLGARVVFLHQLLFMVDSPARLIGRWRLAWSKFHGPFRFETDDPAAALEFPLQGELAALGCWAAADNAIIEISDGAAPAFTLQARAAAPRPLYALATVRAAGAAPVRVRAGGPGWLRLFGIGFAAPQPWLPAAPRLDAARLVRAFERQAAQGFIDDVS